MPRRPPPGPTAYFIAAHGTRDEILDALRDPTRTADDVAALAPLSYNPDSDAELVRLALTHPVTSHGIVARYATHHDATIRLMVVQHPLVTYPALQILALDLEPTIAAIAQDRLAHPDPIPPAPPVHRPRRR